MKSHKNSFSVIYVVTVKTTNVYYLSCLKYYHINLDAKRYEIATLDVVYLLCLCMLYFVIRD